MYIGYKNDIGCEKIFPGPDNHCTFIRLLAGQAELYIINAELFVHFTFNGALENISSVGHAIWNIY